MRPDRIEERRLLHRGQHLNLLIRRQRREPGGGREQLLRLRVQVLQALPRHRLTAEDRVLADEEIAMRAARCLRRRVDDCRHAVDSLLDGSGDEDDLMSLAGERSGKPAELSRHRSMNEEYAHLGRRREEFASRRVDILAKRH